MANEVALAMRYAMSRLDFNQRQDLQNEIMGKLEDFYDAAGLIKGNAFVNESVLFHAGISLRVTDSRDGEQYGMQTIVGSTNKKEEDGEGIMPYHLDVITHKMPYKEAKCSIRPLKETHFFLNVDTHINYRYGIEEIVYNDTQEVKDVAAMLGDTMKFLFESREGITTWLRPMRPKTWGKTVDNLLKRSGNAVLTSYRDGAPVESTGIRKRYKAVQILNADPYAFRLPKTMEINEAEIDKIEQDLDSWFESRIYSVQYMTKLGIRQRFKEASVSALMANTQIIIKHYDRLQIDLKSLRDTINVVVGPYINRQGHRRKNKRPWINNDKSVFIRYIMRDNSLLNSFLEIYIAKAKEQGGGGDDDGPGDLNENMAGPAPRSDSDDDIIDPQTGETLSPTAFVSIRLESDDESSSDSDPTAYVQIDLENSSSSSSEEARNIPTLAPEPRRSARLRQRPQRNYRS